MNKLLLHYSPGACSLASHIALEEAELPYELSLVDFKTSSQQKPEYLAVNPFGRVPALVVDGNVLTESIAILSYIADLVPEKKLLPAVGTWERAKANELFAILAGTTHIAFRSMFRPDRLATSDEAKGEVLALGGKTLARVLSLLDERITGPYALGDSFTLCDAHLFVFTQWMKRPAVAGRLTALPKLEAFAARMRERPSVKAAMAQEGLS